jgi:uncharacterized membrane protein YdjX (TVP38/TMEM64 family)
MKQRLWAFLVLMLGILVACWLLGDQLTLARLIEYENSLRQLVAAFPLVSFVVGFLVCFAASLLPGTCGKSIVCGWLFGFWPALLILNTALTLAAVAVFLTIRYLFRDLQDLLRRRFTAWIERLDNTVRRDGAMCLVTLRLLHAPYSLTNYLAAATAVKTRTFWWTTQLGMLPGNIAFVLAGSQLPTLEQMVEQGPSSLVNMPLLVGLSAAGLTLVATHTAARRWRSAAGQAGAFPAWKTRRDPALCSSHRSAKSESD